MPFTSAVTRSRWSDLAVAAAGQFLAALGTFLVMVTLVLALQQRGASGLEVAALIICEALPMVALGKLIGLAVDRFDSRWILILSGIGQVAACLALSVADDLTSVLIGATALAVASGVAMPARAALVPAMVTRDDLPKASAIGQTASSAGMMLGPALAGFLVGGLGVERTTQLAAALFLGTIVAGLTIRTRRGGRWNETAPVSPAAPGAITALPDPSAPALAPWSLRQDRLLRSTAWGLAAVLCTISAVNVVLVFFIMRTLGGNEQQYGLVDSMWTVGMLVGAWLFSRLVRPSTTDRTLALGLFVALGIIALSLIGIGTVSSALWIVPFYLIGGTQNGGLNVIAGTLLGRRVPADARGRANTALAMRVQGGALVGYAAGGLLLELASARWIVLGCGVLGLAMVLLAAPVVVRAARSPEPVPA